MTVHTSHRYVAKAMGVEVSAIIEHTMNAEQLRRLPDQLNANSQLADVIQTLESTAYGGRKLRRSLPKWKWDCDVTFTGPELDRIWRKSGQLDLSGPLQTIYFSRKVCHLAIWWIRYEYFLSEHNIQHSVRSMVACILATVNPERQSALALYVPDSAYPESRATDECQMSLDELCKWMRKHFGPPAPDLGSMYTELSDGLYEPRGYFIDRLDGVPPANAK